MFTPKQFDWDDDDDVEGNVHHMWTKHRVTAAEVEVMEVFEGAPLVILTAPETDDMSAEYAVIGYTVGGRMLEVYGSLYKDPPRQGWWRTFTAFDADKEGRSRYLKEKGGY